MQKNKKKAKSISQNTKILVVWLNKSTFTGGDDSEEIYYQKMEYKE